VTIMGSVGTHCDDPLAESELRHWELQTAVYDGPKRPPIQFSVACFFESGRRWEKTKTPSSGSYISVTAKIVGRIVKTNHLALRVLDFSFLPKPSSTAPNQMSTSTPASKRSDRWDRRTDSSSPLKKMRTSGFGTGSADGSPAPRTPRVVDNNDADLQLEDEIMHHLNDTSSTRHTSSSPTPVNPN
jgi:hypothetical protein